MHERQLVLDGGRAWRQLHVYAWLSFLAVSVFQAPIVSADCIVGFEADEGQPSKRCSIFMQAIGLYKLHVSRCDERICEGSAPASEMIRLLVMWVMIDLQHHIFRHTRFQVVVVERYQNWCRLPEVSHLMSRVRIMLKQLQGLIHGVVATAETLELGLWRRYLTISMCACIIAPG